MLLWVILMHFPKCVFQNAWVCFPLDILDIFDCCSISSMHTVQCILIQKTKCIIQKEYFQSSETWGHKLAPWIFDVGVGLSILSVQYLWKCNVYKSQRAEFLRGAASTSPCNLHIIIIITKQHLRGSWLLHTAYIRGWMTRRRFTAEDAETAQNVRKMDGEVYWWDQGGTERGGVGWG